MLKINTRHIVPAEAQNGFVINLPELLLYHFMMAPTSGAIPWP